MKKHLLLLEDDLTLSETLSEFLEEKGFHVCAYHDGLKAEEALFEEHFDILLLDVNVPSLSGFELLLRIREQGNTTPAIFLTSLNGLEDVEKGYNSGCDDYIRKPFALKELLLRIETILKREFFHSPHDTITLDKNIYFNITNNTLFVNQMPISLQNKEAKLLKLFLQKQNEIISHETILSTLWEYDETSSDEALRTYIKNLRKIIGKDKIVSFKKLGYTLKIQ